MEHNKWGEAVRGREEAPICLPFCPLYLPSPHLPLPITVLILSPSYSSSLLHSRACDGKPLLSIPQDFFPFSLFPTTGHWLPFLSLAYGTFSLFFIPFHMHS